MSDLRNRAAKAAGKEVERPDRLSTLKDMLDKLGPEIRRALPAHLSPERMARIAYTTVRYTPKLARCSDASIVGAVLTAVQLGMEPGGPTGEAFLVPYWNKDTKSHEAQFQLGYKGMAKLFWQHPLAAYLDAQTVYEADEFDYAYGLEPKLHHKPARGDRGPVLCWYAVAKLTNGGFRFAVLFPEDIDRHRKRSSSPNSPAWREDYDRMAEKTCVRVLFNLLPKSAEMSRALAADGTVRTDPNVDPTEAAFIEGEVLPEDDLHQPINPLATPGSGKCDGDHAMPPCEAPNCWHKDAPDEVAADE